MPIYEYRCPNGHVFEVLQRMNDAQPEGCEVCGKGPLERVLHPVAIHYKGSGFYATDYGRGSRRQVKEFGSDSGGEGGKSGESKKETGKTSGGSDS
ncbi:MAG: FmdB family zinc ribbon protein [Gaiellaceae bacterium]